MPSLKVIKTTANRAVSLKFHVRNRTILCTLNTQNTNQILAATS